MKLVLQDFAPDLDSTIFPSQGRAAAYLVDSNWVYSIKGGWAAMPSPLHAPNNPHIPSRCLGCFYYENPVKPGFFLVAMMTNNQVYLYEGGAAVSQGLALTGTDTYWTLTVYGKDVIAANGVDKPVASINGAAWAPLPGNPPVFSIIEATDFSLFGIIPNSQEFWFTLNDQIWIADIATQTGFNFLTGTPGNITAAHRLRAGIAIFKEQALYNGSFVGPPLFWDFNAVSETVGTLGENLVVSADDVLYFIGPNEFYSFDGYSLNPIPNNLREWFFANVNLTAAGNGLVRGAYDQPRRQVMWFFQSAASDPAAEYTDRYISYSLQTGRWSTGYRKVETPIFNGNQFTFGFVDEAHMLRLMNQGTNDRTEQGWLTTGGIGDKTNIWRLARVQPGWLSIPAGDPIPIPSMPTLDVYQTYIPGQPSTKSQTCRWSPQTGFFDFVTAGRLQNLRVTIWPGMSIADLDVDVAFAGRQ